VLANYRSFLAIPGARRLLLSAVTTRMPNGMVSLSVVLLLHSRSGSFALPGIAVGSFALCSAAMSPLQGMLVDRLGQPRVLAWCAIGQGTALVALVLAVRANLPAALLVVLVGCAGALVPPSMACARALWPRITPDAATLDAAYALDAIILEAAWILGPLLVVAVVALGSSSAALLLCVAITLGGTAALATSPHSRGWRAGADGPRPRAGAMSSAALRRLLLTVGLTGFWWGALQVGFPALAVHAGSRAAAGVMIGLVSLGGVLGGLAYGARRWQAPIERRYAALLLALGLLLVPLTLARSLAAAIPLSLLAGLALTPALSAQNTLVGLAAPRAAMTEAFTWTTAAMFAGVAAGSTSAGALVDAAGVGAPFAAASAAVALAGLLAALRGRRRHARTASAPPLVAAD
jgi:predicted MFS family arabinose efflux permease